MGESHIETLDTRKIVLDNKYMFKTISDFIFEKKSKRLQKIGEFITEGKIIVTDPCYDLTKDRTKLKVKKGLYQSFVMYGSLSNPLFHWDSVPGNYRNSHLIIVHDKYINKKLKFTKTKSHIGVDSGQAGFFNQEYYQKDLDVERELLNNRYHFFKEQITSDLLDIKWSTQALVEKDKNDLFARLKKKCFKNSEIKTIEHFNQEIKIKKESLKRHKQILKNKKYPSYIPLKSSKDFYDIMCDFTCGEFKAGVDNLYGTVSSSGLGDGGYELYVARNTDNEIISCYIEFLPLSEMKIMF